MRNSRNTLKDSCPGLKTLRMNNDLSVNLEGHDDECEKSQGQTAAKKIPPLQPLRTCTPTPAASNSNTTPRSIMCTGSTTSTPTKCPVNVNSTLTTRTVNTNPIPIKRATSISATPTCKLSSSHSPTQNTVKTKLTSTTFSVNINLAPITCSVNKLTTTTYTPTSTPTSTSTTYLVNTNLTPTIFSVNKPTPTTCTSTSTSTSTSTTCSVNITSPQSLVQLTNPLPPPPPPPPPPNAQSRPTSPRPHSQSASTSPPPQSKAKEDPKDMEEEFKKAAKISGSLPPVLIRKILFCDGNRPGRGNPPKPKTKNRGRSYRGSSYQIPFPKRRGHGTRMRSRDSGNIRRGQRGIRLAQSLSSLANSGDQNACLAEAIEQSRFQQNQLLVTGLSTLTTEDCLVNFIEVMSSEEVEDVMMRNGKALITMANDIADFSKIKTKGEERGLDSAKVTIEQVPVSAGIVVSGISNNTTHDAIELYFESRRCGGGPVERVEFTPKGGRAVVVFQDPKDIKGVLARQKEKPHMLDQARLSIRNYHEFLESQEGDVLGDSDLDEKGTDAGGMDKGPVSQQSEIKKQKLHIAVDPDVMEFVNTSAFGDQLSNSLATKKCEITWKPKNKMAVIVHQGGGDSDSWQSESIDEVQNYLGKFAKRDVQVTKNFWGAVVAQLSSIRACLGVDPPLVKLIDDSFVTRIVSLSTAIKDYEERLRSKLEEIYREETRKTYSKKTVSKVPKERLILLKKIKFVEKLQEKNKELEIKLDTEGEEIYFEGPQRHVNEATEALRKQLSDMVEKRLTLFDSIVKVLRSEEGVMKVKCELEKNNVEAAFAIGKDARVVGTSAAHADNAASLVKKLFDSIREEKFVCSSRIVRRYLSEICQEDLLSIEDQLKDFKVKIKKGKGDDDFEISGTENGLISVRQKLDALIKDSVSETFEVKKPCLQKFFDSGNVEHLAKSVEKDQDCVIHVQRNFGQTIDDSRSQAEGVNCASSESNDDGIIGDDDDEEEDEEEEEEKKKQDDHAGGGSAACTLITLFTDSQQKISLKTGNIETEKVDVLVSSVGATSEVIVNAGVPLMATRWRHNVGDITVHPGLPLASYVIHTKSCQWNNGKGEATLGDILHKCLQKGEELGVKSIAFPVIGRPKILNFPWDTTPRIILEETISFCQANPASKLRDIRFIVFEQDQALTAVFKQEMDKLKAKRKLFSFLTKSGLLNSIKRSIKFPQRVPCLKGRIHTQVLQGNGCQETTNQDLSGHGQPRQKHGASREFIVHICVLGKKIADVEKAVESLKKGFSEACATEKAKVEHEAVSQLFHKQVVSLGRKAEDRDVKLVVEANVDRSVVRGQPTDVSDMVGEIWKEINERTKKNQEEEQAQLVSRNIEWSYEIHGSKMVFDRKTIARIETAWSKNEPRVQVSFRGEQFVIDLKTKTGCVTRTGEQITLTREVKGAEEEKAQVYKELGDAELAKEEFQNALSFYTQGINVNCKDDQLNVELYQCRWLSNCHLGNLHEAFEDLNRILEITGIALPEYWNPMPSANMTVHTVELSPRSSEYQTVLSKFETPTGRVNIHKIERIQYPHLYQRYMARKQNMDKDLGGNSERQLFHGTDSKYVSHINTQGFNRSFCETHGFAFGLGTYFARDTKCSIRYAERGGGGPRYMYLARVLVGQYCVGNSSIRIVPPAKNKSRPEILYESVVNDQGNPSIFVVFCDNQCYPEYLITLGERFLCR